jgi:hypothetical protein
MACDQVVDVFEAIEHLAPTGVVVSPNGPSPHLTGWFDAEHDVVRVAVRLSVLTTDKRCSASTL